MSTAIEIENHSRVQKSNCARTYSWSHAVYKRRSSIKILLAKLQKRFAAPKAVAKTPVAVDKQFLKEFHHNTYGRPWALGRYQFDFLKSRGLLPGHKLLDFGCGSGRFAIWAIEYLDSHCYFGIDSHAESLEAFADYEIPLRGLEEKSPRLLLDSKINLGLFETKFDWIMDFYSSRHLDDSMLEVFYQRVAECLNPGGKLICSPKPRLSCEQLQELGLRITNNERQECPLLKGHSFEDWNDWWEIIKE